jgi:small subunit ribosomal protein S3Ae
MAKPVKKSKAVDKWKMKKNSEVLAPDIFNNVPIGPIFADTEEAVIDRTIETTMSKLVNSNQHHIKVMLQVIGTRGFQALTEVKEVELSRAYVSSQANPGLDIIENVFSVKSKDGRGVRLKTLMFTRSKVHAAQKNALRLIAEDVIKSSAERLDYSHIVQEVVFGKIGSHIFNRGKKIVPLGRVEIRKLELVREKKE